jgi:hypothetical protein
LATNWQERTKTPVSRGKHFPSELSEQTKN